MIPPPFGITKRFFFFFFSWFEFCFEMCTGFIFIFLQNNLLRATVGLFFSTFFQSSFHNLFIYLFISLQLHLFLIGLIFYILCDFSQIYSWFNVTVVAYWKHLLSSLIGFIVIFIQSGESIYDPLQFIIFLTFVKRQINTIKD